MSILGVESVRLRLLVDEMEKEGGRWTICIFVAFVLRSLAIDSTAPHSRTRSLPHNEREEGMIESRYNTNYETEVYELNE